MKLDVYILRQLAVAFAISAGGILFIALPGIAVTAVSRLAGVSTVAILKFIPMVVAGFMPHVLPIAFLISVVATYGRMAADREWTAILMSGRNPWRMLFPAFVMALFVSGGIYFLNSEALPWINYKQRSFLLGALRDVIKNLNPGQTELSTGPFFLAASSRVDDTFYDVFLEFPDPDVDGETQTAFAGQARFDFTDTHMVVQLKDVSFVRQSGKGRFHQSTALIPLDKIVEEEQERYDSPRYKSSGELLSLLSGPDLEAGYRRVYTYAIHLRISNAATCLMFVLLGVPTGIFLQRGTQLAALAAAVGYAILYWLFSLRLGGELSKVGAVPSVVAAWGPLLIWVAGALFFAWRILRR